MRAARAVSPLLVLPALIFFAVFFIAPLGRLLYTSFHVYSSTRGVGDAWTLANYTKFLTDPFYLDALYRTLRISSIVTAVAVVTSYPVALFLSQAKGGTRHYLTLLLLSPLMISMVIRAYGWVIILGTHGPVVNVLKGLHLAAPTLLYNDTAVIIGMVHISVAYTVLTIAGSLERIDPSLVRAAKSLGATNVVAFLKVTLPLSFPGIAAGAVIVFSLAASSFVTPSILGGPKVKLLSYFIYDQVAVLLNWPFGAAIGFILIAVSTVLLLAFSRLLVTKDAAVSAG